MTTFRSYEAVGVRRQGEIIRELAKPQPTGQSDIAALIARAVARELASHALSTKT